MSKRRAESVAIPVGGDESDILKITPLGGGQEVGRSCILLEYKGKTVMLDCGLHPAHSGLSALPFFDNIDPESVDLLLVTHFHLDHAASLPYFLEKTTFKGRVFMTHPTKAIFKWLLSDFVKVSNIGSEEQLYDEQDLLRAHDKIEPVDYHQEVEVDGIRFTPYYAGHVLGAAMYLIEIAGVKVLYTGDYSREEDRHLRAAERPPAHITPDVLICESTYGVQSHEPRLEREARFTRWVHDIVARGGRCLIPVFALGWTQELLLILDEYWQNHPQLHNVPIYYASSLAKKCMAVYQTYTNMMNDRIRKQVAAQTNPFHFRHISNLRSIQHFDDVGPCVMMASPGMLQSGLSRELLEMWCIDRKNGLIIPGYVVEGTLGKDILSEPDEIPTMAGKGKLPRRLEVHYISFSAHVDYQQNSQFIEEVNSPYLVLVHGEANEMGRLKGAMQSRYAERDEPLHIYSPKNCETVELYFRGEKLAKTIGSLATEPPTHNALLSGILIGKDYQFQFVDADDLQEFTDLRVERFVQRATVPAREGVPFSLIKWHLEQMYGSLEKMAKGMYKIFDVVTITDQADQFLLEWEGNAINDMIADTVLAIIIQAESSPASVKATKQSHSHDHDHHHSSKQREPDFEIEKEDFIGVQEDETKAFSHFTTLFLQQHFGFSNVEPLLRSAEDDEPEDTGENEPEQGSAAGKLVFGWKVVMDNDTALVNVDLERSAVDIDCGNDDLRKRVLSVITRARKTLRPIGEAWTLPVS